GSSASCRGRRASSSALRGGARSSWARSCRCSPGWESSSASRARSSGASPTASPPCGSRRSPMSAARLETFLQTHRRARPPSGDGVRFVELPQATLRVRVAGTGPVALVIVPDPPNVIEHYDRLIALLAPHLRVVCWQTPAWSEALGWVRRIDRRGLLQTPWLGQLAMSFGKRRVARGWYRAALPPGADPAPFLAPALAAFERGSTYCLASAFQAACRTPAPRLGPV